MGIIDVKIAFTEEGIFHDKFGIMEDEIGDIICFRGSNNETAERLILTMRHLILHVVGKRLSLIMLKSPNVKRYLKNYGRTLRRR